MEKHYTKDELEMYRHGQMSLLGRMQCAAHLRECPDCRTLLDELESDDEFVRELRDSIKAYREIGNSTVSKHPTH